MDCANEPAIIRSMTIIKKQPAMNKVMTASTTELVQPRDMQYGWVAWTMRWAH